MTTDFVKSFQVREYECDAYGHLNNANYVRYLHETTLEALKGLGALAPRSEPPKGVWYPCELFVDYLQPAFYGDSLQIQAKPVLQGDQQLVWAYEVSKEPDAQALSRAQFTYGIVDPVGGGWQPVPETMIDTVDGAQPLDIEFPRMPPPPSGGAFTRPWMVQWRDVSQDGVVQVGAYLDYLLDFVLQAAAACGWTFQHALEEGYALVVRRKWMRLFRPARYGEDLKLSTWLSPLRRSSVTRHFIIERISDGGRIGEAHTLWVGVDLQTGRPMRIPEAWAQDFKSQISYG